MESNNTSLVTSEVAKLLLKNFKGGDQQPSLKLEKLISNQLDKTNRIYDVLAGSFLVSAPKGGNRDTKIPYVFSINLKKIAAHLESIDKQIQSLSKTPVETKREESKTAKLKRPTAPSLAEGPTSNLVGPTSQSNNTPSINPLGTALLPNSTDAQPDLLEAITPKTLDVNIKSFEGKSAISSLEEMLGRILPKAFAEALSGIKGLGGKGGEGGGGSGGGGGFLSGGITALLAKWGLGKFFGGGAPTPGEGPDQPPKKKGFFQRMFGGKEAAATAEEGAEAAAKKGATAVAAEGAEQVAKKGIFSRLGSKASSAAKYLKSGGLTAGVTSAVGGLGFQAIANKLTDYDPTFRKQDPEDLKQRVEQLKVAGDKEGLADYKEFVGYQKENVQDEMTGKGASLGGQLTGSILGRLKPVQNFTSNIASAVKSKASSAVSAAKNVGTTIAKEVTSKATQLSARFTKSSAAQKRTWRFFMGFLKRRSPSLFAKVGIRLLSAAGLAVLPVVGWIAAAVEIGMLAWTMYDIYNLYQEFRALDDLEQAGYETDEKELLAGTTPDSELSKLNENDLKNEKPKTRGEAAAQRDLKATPPKQPNKEDLAKQITDAKKKLEETTKSTDKDKLQKIEALNKEIQQLEQQASSTLPVAETPKVEAPKPVAETPKIEAPKSVATEARKAPPINVDRDLTKNLSTDIQNKSQLIEQAILTEELFRKQEFDKMREVREAVKKQLQVKTNNELDNILEQHKHNTTLQGLGLLSTKTLGEEELPTLATPADMKDKTIPKLKDGVVATKPIKAVIGEAGPEAVFPLEKLEKFLSKNNSRSDSILQKIAENTGLTNGNLGGLIKGFNNLSKALKEAGAIKQAPIVVNNTQEQPQKKISVSQAASMGNPDHMEFRAGISNDMFAPV